MSTEPTGEPPDKPRGIVRAGARGGAIGLMGCLTFTVGGLLVLVLLVYACSAAAA